MVTIVWDVDDVLNDLMRLWLTSTWGQGRPAPLVAFEDLRSNPPDEVLGMSRRDYLSSLDAFRHEEACAAQPPHREVMAWFEAHGHRCRHVALTAVPLHAAALSAEWVMRRYGRWIRCFGVVPSPREGDPPGGPVDKREWLEWFGPADVFVDDSEANVAAVRELGVRGVVFPRPWNSARRRSVADALAEVTAVLDGDPAGEGRRQRGGDR